MTLGCMMIQDDTRWQYKSQCPNRERNMKEPVMKKGVCSRLKKFNCEGFFTTIVHHKIRAEEKLTQIRQEPSTPPTWIQSAIWRNFMPVIKIGLKFYLPDIPVVLFHHCPNCIPFKLCLILAEVSGHCPSYLPLIQLKSSQTCSGFKQRPLWSTLKTSCFVFYNLAPLLCK